MHSYRIKSAHYFTQCPRDLLIISLFLSLAPNNSVLEVAGSWKIVGACKPESVELIDIICLSQHNSMIFCSNCEERAAKVNCIQCDQPMCMGCSITHPSVKIYKGHKFRVIVAAKKPILKQSVSKKGVKGVRFDEAALAREASRSSKLCASEVSVEEMTESTEFDTTASLQPLVDTISSYLWADDWQSRLVVMLVTFISYALLKLFLGRLSVVILVVCAFAVIRNVSASKNYSARQAKGSARSWWDEIVLEVRELCQAGEALLQSKTSDGQAAIKDLNRVRQELYNTTAVPEYDENEFKEEFWHNPKPRRRKMQVQIKGTGRDSDDPSIAIR